MLFCQCRNANMDLKRPTQHASNRRSAFTLTELMISIALSLVLILGVNAVFKLSSDSVGTGFQLMQMNRQFRLVGNTMNNDFSNMADFSAAPALIIQSMNTPAFRDKTDMATEPNFTTGSITLDGMLQITTPSGGTLYPLTPAATYPAWASISQANLYKVRYEIADDRNHRTDILSFFANGDTYHRQTSYAASATGLQSDFHCNDAWVWYGHTLLPDNTAPGNWTNSLGLSSSNAANNSPSSNPNNFFASQWVLGRVAMLMVDPSTQQRSVLPPPAQNVQAPPPLPIWWYDSNIAPVPPNNGYQPQNYLWDTYQDNGPLPVPTPVPNPTAVPLPPLGYTSMTNDSSMTPPYATPVYVYQSLCDLAGQSIVKVQKTVLDAEYSPGTPTDTWYWPLVAQYSTSLPTGPYTSDQAYRFWAKPWPNKSSSYSNGNATGLLTQEIARSVPVFCRGCSQFIVEYAGDYLQQDATGKVTDIGEDGQLDYDVITNATTGQTYKRIRWYGLTRSLDGGITVEDANTLLASNPPGAGDTEIVRPLWRYVQQLYKASQGLPGTALFDHLPFEKVGDGSTPTPATVGGAGFPVGSPPNNTVSTKYQTGYTCAWAPDDIDLDLSKRNPNPPNPDVFYNLITLAPPANINGGKPYFPSRSMLPWLIRVTVRLDDPNGRVPQGQQMEFIFKVKRN